MFLVAGSYERFLFGLAAPSLPPSEPSTSPAALSRAFTYAAHRTCVKCVDAAGPYVASGGSDDLIHLYDIRGARDTGHKDLGFLMNPGDGSVPCLSFFTPQASTRPTHLFSGSADGAVCIWRVGGGWEHLKSMRGHTAAVNALSVHPSGGLALSVGRDRTIRMWNLVNGRCSFTSKLDTEGDIVSFSPSGTTYTLVCGARVTAHAAAGSGALFATFNSQRRVLCAAQHSDDTLLAGLEDGSMVLWDLRSSTLAARVERAHATRVRGLAVVPEGADGAAAGTGRAGGAPAFVATGASDGVVKVWDLRMLGRGPEGAKGEGKCVGMAETRARLTCLCVAHPVAGEKRRKKKGKGKGKAKGAEGVGAAGAAGADRAGQVVRGLVRAAKGAAVPEGSSGDEEGMALGGRGADEDEGMSSGGDDEDEDEDDLEGGSGEEGPVGGSEGSSGSDEDEGEDEEAAEEAAAADGQIERMLLARQAGPQRHTAVIAAQEQGRQTNGKQQQGQLLQKGKQRGQADRRESKAGQQAATGPSKKQKVEKGGERGGSRPEGGPLRQGGGVVVAEGVGGTKERGGPGAGPKKGGGSQQGDAGTGERLPKLDSPSHGGQQKKRGKKQSK